MPRADGSNHFTLDYTLRSVVPDHIVQGLGKIFNIVGVETSHADAAVLGHVDMPLLPDGQDLLLGDAGEAEHADLTGDVFPVARGSQSIELGFEGLSLLNYATRHGFEIFFPLGKEGRVVQDRAGNAGTISGRV